MSASAVKVGQIWRSPDDGYLYKIVHVDDRGRIWARHPNQRQGGMVINPAWFDHYEMTRDA